MGLIRCRHAERPVTTTLATSVNLRQRHIGQIHPAVNVLILHGRHDRGAIHAQVQDVAGNFAPTSVAVGDLFAARSSPPF